MNKKKWAAACLAALFAAQAFTLPVSAETLFEENDEVSTTESVDYEVISLEGSVTGGKETHNTLTEDQQNAAFNDELMSDLQKEFLTLVRDYYTGSKIVYLPPQVNQVVTLQKVTLPVASLEKFLDKLGTLKGSYPHLIEYSRDGNPPYDGSSDNINALMQEFTGDGNPSGYPFAPFERPNQNSVDRWDERWDGELWSEAKQDWVQVTPGSELFARWVMQNFSIDVMGWNANLLWDFKEYFFEVIRPEIIPGGFIDQATIEERMKIVKAWLDSHSSSANINTLYILEQKVTKEETHAAVYSLPQKCYRWAVYDDETGALEQILTTYVPKISLTFWRAGKYRIEVSQDVSVTYADKVTYDENHYWTDARTGQVYWKGNRYSKVKLFNQAAPVIEQRPLKTILQPVTEDMVGVPILAAPNSVQQAFQTERVE